MHPPAGGIHIHGIPQALAVNVQVPPVQVYWQLPHGPAVVVVVLVVVVVVGGGAVVVVVVEVVVEVVVVVVGGDVACPQTVILISQPVVPLVTG
jgi:hypothetical protein